MILAFLELLLPVLSSPASSPLFSRALPLPLFPALLGALFKLSPSTYMYDGGT